MSLERAEWDVERSAPCGAVFLSYASQDAAVVKRIADALRDAGIEVWFDQNELVGGDAWDQKIRKQIKECALFLPVISAHTQARREGYFRLEWKLAEDRTHLMAKGTPFLVPVCIDGTKDGEALVPDSFLTVQWTRLRPLGDGGQDRPEDEDPGLAKFVARVEKLLAGDVARVSPGLRRPGEAGRPMIREPAVPETRATPRVGRRRPVAAWVVAAAGIGLIAVGGALWLRRPIPTAPAVAAQAGFPRDPELRRALAFIDSLEATREDFRLADEISARVVERAPTDPEAVTVRARVHSAFVTRSFDFSADRTAQAKRFGERAVQLAPENPEAHHALSLFLYDRSGDFARSEAEARRACALAPDDARFQRQLLRAINRQRPDEALALGEELVKRFPRDPLVRYDLSILYRNRREWERFERELDATLALAPVANAINWKSRAALLRGDLDEMRRWLDRVPARTRTEERTVVSSIIYATLSGDYDYGLAALRAFAEPWFFDAYYYAGPAALPQAMLLEQQGKTGQARVRYEEAMAALSRHRQEHPADQTFWLAEIWTLRGLGRLDEARVLHRTALENLARPYRINGLAVWWTDVIPRCLLLGDRGTALQLIREAAATDEGRRTIALRMKQDVRMAPFRDDPEIAVLLADPPAAAKPTLANAAPPSVATPLVARARTLFTKLNYTREDLATAEDLARRATEQEPDSAMAWGVRAGVHATYIYRLWDVSDRRRQDTQTFAGRALGLNPHEPEALLAMGHLLSRQGALPAAMDHFRRALAADPANNRIARALSTSLRFDGRHEEARAVLQAAVQRDSRDPLLWYDLASTYPVFFAPDGAPTNVKLALEHLDAGLAVQPLASLLIAKAVAQAGWLGDLPAMRATLAQLEQLPVSERVEDRAVFVAVWGALLERDESRVLAAARLTAKDYFEDTLIPRRPKDWSVALAYRLAGKENLARLNWQRAEVLLRQRLRHEPTNPMLGIELATTLAWLGRKEEALREVAPFEAAAREEATHRFSGALADFYGAMGDAARAAPYLNQGLNRIVFLTSHTLPLDPWFDQLRGRPEFEAVLQEAAARK